MRALIEELAGLGAICYIYMYRDEKGAKIPYKYRILSRGARPPRSARFSQPH